MREAEDRPTVSIYQNGEHVAGILQQAYRQPLLTEASTGASHGSSREKQRSRGIFGRGATKGSVPFAGGIEGGIGADYQGRDTDGASSEGTSTSTWKYTQSYYLYAVRDALCQFPKSAARVPEVLCTGAGRPYDDRSPGWHALSAVVIHLMARRGGRSIRRRRAESCPGGRRRNRASPRA